MNEGKPTRPKWWHRGVRETGPGHTEPTPTLAEPEGHGDAEGDFRLAPPAQDRDHAAALAKGDFELPRPVEVGTVDAPAAGTADAPRAASADGDYELSAPRTATDTAAAPRETGGPQPEAPGEAEAQADAADPTLAARPAPLHDPDPYGTPPYGEPGPWAPAPPVQHPAVTPTQDTAIPPSQDTPASHLAPPADLNPPPPADPASTPTPSLEPTPAPTPNPWQNYDPWAPAPFQQRGVGVEDKDTRRRRVRRALVGGAVVLALVSGGVGGVIGAYLERDGGIGAVTLPQAGKEPAGRAPDSVAGIAARALPSVVTLHVTGVEESGTGTGFVLDDLGHILTNNHVVEPAGSSGKITVTFNSGDTAKATVVGRDSGYDLAVVKVTGVRGLKPLPLGNSDNVQVGDPVVAIGAPFDLAGTVTSGIISAKERPITAGGDSTDGSDVSYVDALQTDAPINPGNSGGPLLDSRGRVIGINSAIRSADDGSDSGSGQAGSIGLGFAIPVNQARRVAEELINTGRATHPVIGVTLDMNYTGDGARVGKKAADGGPAVTAGGPGAKAGIKAGDVITAVDGVRVHSGEELIVRTRAHRPGDRLRLTVRRGGGERTISLVLGSSDSN
ncbi:trypsin-like peptidase domain-containing protein [Streptomyces gilvus]|uniref:trypsin-like peptidase domain-containing protein n=1 Tax=Streptomyces gilvus TaxID=2920937 RepID=UPI001F0FC7EB|nr:trypsin-like peptidase domain-containing protein [Streptomyces sp. CME 23]MCH5672814.1 trypsin-like peptidase domain-containing protein [Streptomyces sp. CME 23]